MFDACVYWNQYVTLNRMILGPSTPVGDRNVAIGVNGAVGSPATRICDTPVLLVLVTLVDEPGRTAYVVFAFSRL